MREEPLPIPEAQETEGLRREDHAASTFDDSELALRAASTRLGVSTFFVKGQMAALSGSSLKRRRQLRNATIAAHAHGGWRWGAADNGEMMGVAVF